MTEASRKHVACLCPPAMQLHALRSPIEELVGCARARIWPGSVGSYGLLRMPSVISRRDLFFYVQPVRAKTRRDMFFHVQPVRVKTSPKKVGTVRPIFLAYSEGVGYNWD